jgi:phosphoribosylanthranilate isomerase
VLDTATNDAFGGTGMTFPWQWAREFIAANISQKVILAGGLTPANVAQAIEQARPFGVDVASGVEAVVGRKDIHKVRDFIAAARSAR